MAKGAKADNNHKGRMMAKIHNMAVSKGPPAQSLKWFCQSSLVPNVRPCLTNSTMPFIKEPPIPIKKAANSKSTKKVVRSRDWAN